MKWKKSFLISQKYLLFFVHLYKEEVEDDTRFGFFYISTFLAFKSTFIVHHLQHHTVVTVYQESS